MNGILKGVRPLDYVLAAVLTVAGVYLMFENTTAAYADGLPHPQSTTTAAMVPFFVAVTLPILWRRRNVLAVVALTGAATAVHVVLFGWNTRCGVEIPLLFALSYAVARFADHRRDRMTGLTIVGLALLLMLARDASIATILETLPIVVPGAALFYGAGRVVQNRVEAKRAGTAPVPQPATA